MQNFIRPGHIVPLAAPYDVASGAGALVGSLFGVAISPYSNGAAGEFAIDGVFDLAKNAAEAWTPGEKVYWDNVNKVVTATAAGNTLIGVALLAAANPSNTGRVRLNGTAS